MTDDRGGPFPTLEQLKQMLQLEGTALFFTGRGVQNIPIGLDSDPAFANLRKLCLHNNALQEAPSVQGLKQLEILKLSGNLLTKPPILSGLTKLREVYLQNNQLQEPPNVTGLPNLQVLETAGNRYNMPPAALSRF